MKNPFRRVCVFSADTIIDTAFSAASDKASKLDFQVRRTKYGTTRMKSVREIAMQKEGVRISTCANSLYKRLKRSTQSFPNLRKIPEIYKEFTEQLIGISNMEESISKVNKVANHVKRLQGMYLDKLEHTRHTQQMRRVRKEFYGRVAGGVRKVEADLKFLANAFDVLRKLPSLGEYPTVVISGYPNVGKTSLLRCLTGSKPEVQSYPFTTKGLMIGYMDYRYSKIQFIDTPGMLGRKKSNKIEVQGEIVLHKIADVIVYVFDISETCGFTLDAQLALYKKIKKEIKKPIISVVNKIDVIGVASPSVITKKVKAILISCESNKGIDDLKNKIIHSLI